MESASHPLAEGSHGTSTLQIGPEESIVISDSEGDAEIGKADESSDLEKARVVYKDHVAKKRRIDDIAIAVLPTLNSATEGTAPSSASGGALMPEQSHPDTCPSALLPVESQSLSDTMVVVESQTQINCEIE